MTMQRLLGISCWLVMLTAPLACSAPAVDTSEAIGVVDQAIRGAPNQIVADPSQIGLVEITWWSGGRRCLVGSGVMLTNRMLLTAAHVVDEVARDTECFSGPAEELQLKLPGPAGTQAQIRVFKRGVSAGFPPIESHPNWDPLVGRLLRDAGSPFGINDGAMVFVDWPTSAPIGAPGLPFVVNGTDGITTHFRRALTESATRTNWGRMGTAYGYGHDACQTNPDGGRPITSGEGTPRFALFQVHPAPAFSNCGPPLFVNGCNCAGTNPGLVDPRCTTALFAVVQGGGAQPAAGTGVGVLVVPGDSGGPFLDDAGRLLGINSSVVGPCDVARESFLSSLSPGEPLGDWVRTFFPIEAPPLPIDLDGDGTQDAIKIIQQAGTYAIDMGLSAVNDVIFPTLIPTTGFGGIPSLPAPAALTSGDFNGDNVQDLIGLFAGVPFYMDGGGRSAFNPATNLRTPGTEWHPPSITELGSNPYLVSEVGDFNRDGMKDIAFLRQDGSRDFYLGKRNVGLDSPLNSASTLDPLLGFNFDDDAYEDVAVGAPGFDLRLDICTKFVPVSPGTPPGGPRQCLERKEVLLQSKGAVHIISGDPTKNDDPSELVTSFDQSAFGQTPESDDLFGKALAWGHFTGSGQQLAIGAPGMEAVLPGQTPIANAGAIYLAKKGTSGTPQTALPNFIVGGLANHQLGAAFAAGDFDNDGLDDLAAGAPGPALLDKNSPFVRDDVLMLYGHPDPSQVNNPNGNQHLEPEDLGLSGVTAGESTIQRRFGAALAAGDFNCDGVDDLAVGAPGAKVEGAVGAGAVVVVYGQEGLGLDPDRKQILDRTLPGFPGEPTDREGFGSALVAGNFNGDFRNGRPCIDLAIGEPGHDALGSGITKTGRVSVAYGAPGGINPVDVQVLTEGANGVPGTAERTDRFGADLSVAQANIDGIDDLVVGIPGEGLGAGAVMTFLGSRAGVKPAPTVWRQGASQDGVTIPGKAEAINFTPADPKPYLGIGMGDMFGIGVGGTSNGLIVVGASHEGSKENELDLTKPEAATNNWNQNQGWVGLMTTQGASGALTLLRAVERTPGDFNSPPSENALLGSAITKPRPFTEYVPITFGRFHLGTFYQSEPEEEERSAPVFASFDQGDPPWTSTDASIALNQELFTQGEGSLEVASSGSVESPVFRTSEFGTVGDTIAFDLLVPENATTPFISHLRLSVSIPEAGLQNVVIDELDLDELPQGEWHAMGFALPLEVRAALLGDHRDASFEFTVILPNGASLLLDNLRMAGPQAQPHPWPAFHRSSTRHGQASANGPATGAIAWSTDLAGDVRSSPAVANDGTIYVGSDSNRVYALAPDGTIKWSRLTLGDVRGTPALDNHGRLFVGSDDGKLYALNAATGAILWSYQTLGAIKGSPVLDARGTVYVGSVDGRMYALAAATGVLSWSYQTLGPIQSSPALGPNRTLYFGSDDSFVYAVRTEPGLTAAQRLSWKRFILGGTKTAPAIGPAPDYPVYIGSPDDFVHKLAGNTGAVVWSYLAFPLFDVMSAPAVAADGTVIFGSDASGVWALNPNGTLKWIFHTLGAVRSSPAIGADGTIYVGSDGGFLYALRPDAGLTEPQRLLFSVPLGGLGGLFVRSSPAIGADGRLYVGSDANRLFAVGN